MRTAHAAIVALCVAVTSCDFAARATAGRQPPVSNEPFTAEIRLGSSNAPVNRLIIGSNVQWVDRGDGLLTPDGSQFDRQMLDLVEELEPTVLRYPGGSLTDTFDWRSGSGPIRSRGTSEHYFTRQRQPVLFGTAEFLELCARLGAEPLITVNTATGSANDAADWVRSVNRPVNDIVAGPVRYWEIGNEPYLKEDVRPEVAVDPRTFATRANAFIRAMRDADPTIAIGVPLRRDRLGAVPAVAYPGFADTVLRTIDERFDFVSLHDAYLPFVMDDGTRYQPDDLFKATMAAYQVVEDDLRQTRQLLDRVRPGQKIPFAITEYNAIYTLGGALDKNSASLGSALYVADLLRVLASRDDILMANFWSLTGNGLFGTVSNARQLRPAYQVLRAYARILRGRRLDLEVRGPTFDAPAIGAVPPATGVPLIAAVAAVEAGRISLLVINKSVHTPAVVTVQGGPGRIEPLTVRELGDARVFDPSQEAGSLRWREITVNAEGFPFRLTVGAHALLWVEINQL